MRPWWFAVLLVSMSVVASAAEVAGIKLDERTKLGTSELVLNGGVGSPAANAMLRSAGRS